MNNYLCLCKCHRLQRPVLITYLSVNIWHYVNMKSCQSITVQAVTQYCSQFQGVTIYCDFFNFCSVKAACPATHLFDKNGSQMALVHCVSQRFKSTFWNKFCAQKWPQLNFSSNFFFLFFTFQRSLKSYFHQQELDLMSFSHLTIEWNSSKGRFIFIVVIVKKLKADSVT